MKTKPGINFWVERIDARAVAFHAERRWEGGARPSAFILVALDDRGNFSRYQHQETLERKLEQHERDLYAHYGRGFLQQWRDDGSPHRV